MAELVHQVRNAGCFIFLSSHSAREDSQYVETEIQMAYEAKTRIIPLILDRMDSNDTFYGYLAGLQEIDAVDHPYREWFSELVSAIAKEVGAPTSPPTARDPSRIQSGTYHEPHSKLAHVVDTKPEIANRSMPKEQEPSIAGDQTDRKQESFLATMRAVVINPARVGQRYCEGERLWFGPWKLIFILMATSALFSILLPLGEEESGTLFELEQMAGVGQVFDHELVNQQLLKNELIKLNGFIDEPVILIVVTLALAAGMTVFGGGRSFSNHIKILVYVFIAITAWDLFLHLIFYPLDKPDLYESIGAIMVSAYLVFAVWWLYWQRKLIALTQTIIMFIAFLAAVMIALPVAIFSNSQYVKRAYAEYIDKQGNMDLFVAELSLSVFRSSER